MRTIVLGLVVILACPILAAAANKAWALFMGRFHDSTGAPLVGRTRLLSGAASDQKPERIAFTDSQSGPFAVANLLCRRVLRKSHDAAVPFRANESRHSIECRRFGDIDRQRCPERNGLSCGVRRRGTRRSLQILSGRFVARDPRSPCSDWARKRLGGPRQSHGRRINYSGYFQIYSKSIESSSGTADGMGSQFSVTMPFDPSSTSDACRTNTPRCPIGLADSERTYDFVPAAVIRQ